MAMDVLNESRLRICEAAARVGVNVSTIWRWILRGVRGQKLESALIGGQRYTSEEAVQRFVENINAPAGMTPCGRTSKQREKEIAAAERELLDAGA
jgi:transposase